MSSSSMNANFSKQEKSSLVHNLESSNSIDNRITKCSCRTDFSYFTGRAGLIRILNLLMSGTALGLLLSGYGETKLDESDEADKELIRMMGKKVFGGYGKSKYTLFSIGFGASAAAITLIFIFLLLCIMEVRSEHFWENINQKANVICCILNVLAGFLNVLSIEQVQIQNCRNTRCKLEKYDVKVSKYEEEFYPPYFVQHYAAFVLYLTNAMLHSIASRIWLRNED